MISIDDIEVGDVKAALRYARQEMKAGRWNEETGEFLLNLMFTEEAADELDEGIIALQSRRD
jgi:hypothetical protein